MAVDIKKARENLRKRQEAQKNRNLELFHRAARDFDRIIDMIIEKYDPHKIIQWGSLLDSSIFTEVSDIDIAIEGIDTPEKYFFLIKDAENLTDFPLDIIQLEKIGDIHRDSIIKHGKVIYENGERLC